jgi:protein TonB
MFADSLLDSHWANRSHRGWTTLASFALQTLAVGLLLTLPLIYSEGLPRLRATVITAPVGAPPGQRGTTEHHPSRSQPGRPVRRDFTTPAQAHEGIDRRPDIQIPNVNECLNCVPSGTGPIGALNPVIGSIGIAPTIAPPVPKPTAPPPHVSVMMEGNLIHKVQPVYPPTARSARVQGAVVLRAIISKSGTIENLQVASGHPWLVKAAMDAVRQWPYRPYILNREPVEVETRVTVNFILSGG